MTADSNKAPTRPIFQINVSPKEWVVVAAAARRLEIPVNTLARALFRWAWPYFSAHQFSVERLKERYGDQGAGSLDLDQADKIKEWLYRLYEAMPDDERDVFRGLAEKIHFDVAVPEGFGVGQGKGAGAEEEDKGVRRTAGRIRAK